MAITTAMSRVNGLSTAQSKRATDMYLKTRYLRRLNGGRGLVFATATPIMNTLGEAYVMQKYLRPDEMRAAGVENFDAWAKQFGEIVPMTMPTESGKKYEVKPSFAKFNNVPVLFKTLRGFADVITDVPGLKLPKVKREIVEVPASDAQKKYVDFLARRVDDLKRNRGSDDHIFKIMADGRKMSYGDKFIGASNGFDGSKIAAMADRAADIYNSTFAVTKSQ